MDIIWGHPKALLTLWLLLPAGLLWWYGLRRRQRAALQFVAAPMAEKLMPQLGGSRPWTKGLLLLVALTFVGLAMARPRWGVYFDPMVQRGADLMVLLDVSKSMLSEDVAPSRLERAKSDLRDLLQRVGSDRVGLISFAGRPVLSCPLTTDHGFFQSILAAVGPHSAPRGGTAIGDAIREALQAMEEERDRDQAIVLISDGDDHDSFPLEAAALASERGVKIFAIGLGDPQEGARIPVQNDGGRTFLKHDGQEVWSKMGEELLEQVALKTQGAYIPARTSVYDLGEVYESHLAKLTAGEIRTDKRKRYREQFQLFVGAGLFFFLLHYLLPATVGRSRKAVSVASALLFTAVPAGVAGEPEENNRAGLERYAAGDFEAAGDRFAAAESALSEERPSDPRRARARFNQGTAAHSLAQREDASSHYLSSATARDLAVAAASQYNLGMLAAEGARELFGGQPENADPETREKGSAHLQEAIRHYRACLDLDASHGDARHNLELLRLWLKHMANVWAEKDREKRRDELDLVAFLHHLLEQQRMLTAQTRSLIGEADSPRLRVAGTHLASVQRELLEEAGEHLEQKIQETFQHGTAAMPGAQAQQGPDPEQIQQVLAILQQWAGAAADAMDKAAHDLDGRLLPQAVDHQVIAYDNLDQMWMSLVPFDQILKEAIELESAIVEGTELAVGEPEPGPDSEEDSNNPGAAQGPAAAAVAAQRQPKPLQPVGPEHLERLAEDQTRVGRLSGLLPSKGEQFLAQMTAQMEQMKQMQAAQETPPSPPPPMPSGSEDEEGEDESDEDSEDEGPTPEEQLEAVRRAVEKAQELTPEITELCNLAGQDLLTPNAESALLREKRALELLKEIADELPKQDQNQDSQDQQQDQNSEQNQNQDQQQDQEQQQDSEDQNQQDQEQQQQQQQQLTREQMEALLRRAVEREREAEEKRRELEAAVAVPAGVDRDW